MGFTASDIEKYHKGLLSPKERHALEKAALDDAFLAGALEGYAHAGESLGADLEELRERLFKKTEEARVVPIHDAAKTAFPWKKIAAVLVIVGGAALLSYQFFLKQKPTDIAQVVKKDSAASTRDEAAAKTAEIDSVAESSPGPASPEVPTTGEEVQVTGAQESETRSPIERARTETGAVENDIARAETTNAPVTARAKALSADTIRAGGENENLSKSAGINPGNRGADDNDPGKRSRQQEVAANEEAFYKLKENVAVNRENQRVFHQFRGRVVDAHNNPLPFANVTNTVDNVGTYSDSKGYFTLLSTDSTMNVQIRSLGFENNRSLLRSSRNNNLVTLREDRSIAAVVVDTMKRNFATVPREGNLTLDEPEIGWDTYGTYLANNLNMPEDFDIAKKEVTRENFVELSFEVNRFGDPVRIKVEKSLCDKCDKEAIRLLQQGPKWKRKSKKDKRTTVKVPFIKPSDW